MPYLRSLPTTTSLVDFHVYNFFFLRAVKLTRQRVKELITIKTKAKVIWHKATSLSSVMTYYIMAATLGLIEPEIAPFDPPTLKTLPQN